MGIATGKPIPTTTLFEVDEDGPIDPPLVEGNLIHPENPWGGAGRQGRTADDPPQRPAAGADV